MAHEALVAARNLDTEGISVAVASVPILAPSPATEVVETVGAFEHVVFVDEARAAGSPVTHWIAKLAEQGLRTLKTVRLVCTKDSPIPNAPHLCNEVVAGREDILDAIHESLATQ
jgi:pyruvate/2-oxoglutarate/acetoin dehydrogenase E1 component